MSNSVKFVPGNGPVPCKIAIVAEAPGEDEDTFGLPMIGRSGQLLDKLLESIGLKREEVYVTNIVKVRPENNRKPTKEEIESWKDSLLTELDVVEPMVVLTLGDSATQALARSKYKGKPISELRGKVIREEPYVHIPTLHPSYALRRPSATKLIEQDLLKVKYFIGDDNG